MNHDSNFGFMPLMETINRFKYDFKTNKTIVLETFVLADHKMNFSRFQKLNSKVRFIQLICTSFIFTNFSIQGSTDRIVLNLRSTVHQGQQQSQQFHQKQPKYNNFWTFISLWSSRTFLEFLSKFKLPRWHFL